MWSRDVLFKINPPADQKCMCLKIFVVLALRENTCDLREVNLITVIKYIWLTINDG